MNSIQTRMVLVFSTLFLLASLFLSFSIYTSSNKLVIDSISTQAQSIGELALKKINVENYKEIAETKSETDYYIELRRQLNEIKETNGLKYLYTMGKNGDQYFYVVDGQPMDSEEASDLGEVEENKYSGLIKTFETGKTQIGELSYDKEYGATVTAYVPIIDKSGAIIGALGADFDADNIYNLIKKGKVKMFSLTIVILIIVMLAIFIFSRFLTKPLKTLIAQTERLSKGDFSIEFSSDRKDEIGKLSNSFGTMVQDLKKMISSISDGSNQLNSSSFELGKASEATFEKTEELSVKIKDITNGAKRQVEIITDAVSTIRSISEDLQEITNSIDMMNESADGATNLSEKGHKQVDAAVAQINTIQHAQIQSSKVMGELGEKSKEIGEIVVVITDIANQTNLLALNAAIEAARAGEHGKGFAVVSEEVRKLAEQSGAAAHRISHLINEIQYKTDEAVAVIERGETEVETGAHVVSKSGESFNDIKEAIKMMTSQIQAVTASIQQVSAGSEEIVAIIEEVNQIAIQSEDTTDKFAGLLDGQANVINEVNTSVDQMKKLALNLAEIVKKFKI